MTLPPTPGPDGWADDLRGQLIADFSLYCAGDGCTRWDRINAVSISSAGKGARTIGWRETEGGWLCGTCVRKLLATKPTQLRK